MRFWIKKRRGLCVLLLVIAASYMLTGCALMENADGITSIDQLNEKGRLIGVAAESAEDVVVKKELPQAEFRYYKDAVSGYTSVSQGKLDAYVYGKLAMNTAVENGLKGVRVLDETLGEGNKIGVAISPKTKIPDLQDKVNAFIDEVKADGTMDDVIRRWLVEKNKTMPEIEQPEDPSLHLVVGTTGNYEPYTFYSGDGLAGFDIELAYRFAAWLGASLEFKIYDYDGIVAAAQTGDVDCVYAGLFMTKERMEAVPFSQPEFVDEVGVMVRDTSAGTSFWGDDSVMASVADSFRKTFVVENRWQFFLKGMGTTLMITALAILLGTPLGFGIFMLCRKGNPVANGITKFCVWLVQGMPVVVLLMIFYYVIFAKFAVSGTVASVIAFTLIFASSVFTMMKTGVGTVDRGQTEAAYALGYSDRRAFYRIVMPQVLENFMPAYKVEITTLIKATAIVGYVAVQDLTKMGDIVRSRTFEAFFPLISVAVFYFVLTAILTFIVNRVQIHVTPGRRTREEILKGVKVDD